VTPRDPDPKDIPHLGPALLAARLVRGFARRELAARAGVDVGRVTDFERGRRVPTREQLEAIWSALADDDRGAQAEERTC